jgi:hypothetical protein
MKYRPLGKEELFVLKKGLPHGSLKVIAGKTGYCLTYVSRVLSGVYYNQIIINEAVNLLSSTDEGLTELRKKIQKD